MDRDAPPHSSAPRSGAPTTSSVWPTIAGFAATRVAGNLFVRFPYVFINRISRGLGVDVDTLTLALGARELGGLVAPQAGRWVDRGHVARVIAGGGLLAGISCAVAATAWFPLFVVAMVVGGAAKISVDLAQNAWIGHNVPLDARGRVISIVEMTWAGAFLIGVPALGWAVERFGWQAAFVITGPLLALAALGSGARLREPDWDGDDDLLTTSLLETHPQIAANPARLKTAVWLFCFLQPMAQMLVFAVNGDWFVTSLDMSTSGLAVVMALLGIAELVGTIVTALVTDRLGPIVCGMWGMALTVPPMLGIIVVGEHVVAAVGLMLLMDIAIEFAFVAVLPVVSELDVENRGRAVGHVFVLIMVSRAIGSAIAGVIYVAGGFEASLALGSLACIGAAAALWWARRGVDAAAVRPGPAA